MGLGSLPGVLLTSADVGAGSKGSDETFVEKGQKNGNGGSGKKRSDNSHKDREPTEKIRIVGMVGTRTFVDSLRNFM